MYFQNFTCLPFASQVMYKLTDYHLYWSEGGGEGGHVTRIYAPSGGQTLLVSPFVAPHRKSPRAVICDANWKKREFWRECSALRLLLKGALFWLQD